ncbi:MAG: flavin reductase family protein [Bryobacteraceae bacterium]|jgi:flavin reductase (DIM6/NTAB) family NADH-FMN oxidoreductase RutF
MSSAAVSPDLFRRACALFPTGVAVLSTRASDGTPHGLTVNAFCSLSLTPPLVFVAVDRVCSLLETFEKSGHFAINFLASNQRHLSVRFSELPEGRFSGVSWIPGVEGAPLLDGTLGSIECRTTQIINAGDHRALIGEVIAATIGEGDPLVFFRSAYTIIK